MQYLANQGSTTEGNILANLLKGNKPTSNLVYTPWTPILSNPLSEQGTLYKDVLYKSGPTGHFNGHTVAMTGKYTLNDVNLNINPDAPTIFEYYRKHSDPARSALNAWWLSESLGPYPSLNYSRHPDYGPLYGANYFNAATTFTGTGKNYFANIPDIQPDDAIRTQQVKTFLDNAFGGAAQSLGGVKNLRDEQLHIEQFIKTTINKLGAGQIDFALPTGASTSDLTGDLVNISYGWQVLNEFAPELMVINTTNSDVCHSNFTGYIQNMHKADFGVGWLWDKIQSHPKLKDDTIMICMPEHGRNLTTNTLVDTNGFKAYDHTSDDNSRKIFALIVGPNGKVKRQYLGTSGITQPESIDIVPTIAHILGFYNDIPSGMLNGRVLTEAFN